MYILSFVVPRDQYSTWGTYLPVPAPASAAFITKSNWGWNLVYTSKPLRYTLPWL